jgi:molybdopterin synthase sulfur carrier subunit
VGEIVVSKESPELVLIIRVRLFASLREIAGKGQITMQLSAKDNSTTSVTVGELKKKLSKDYPAILSRKIPIAVAINGTVANDNSTLKDGDEVALLPPVSGG